MPTPNVSLPGSPEAVAAGCKCPELLMVEGYIPGWTVAVNLGCQLHGRPAWEAAACLCHRMPDINEPTFVMKGCVVTNPACPVHGEATDVLPNV